MTIPMPRMNHCSMSRLRNALRSVQALRPGEGRGTSELSESEPWTTAGGGVAGGLTASSGRCAGLSVAIVQQLRSVQARVPKEVEGGESGRLG